MCLDFVEWLYPRQRWIQNHASVGMGEVTKSHFDGEEVSVVTDNAQDIVEF